MRELGMKPVAPAFCRFCAAGVKRVFPEAETFTLLVAAEESKLSHDRHGHSSCIRGRTISIDVIGMRFIQEYKACLW